MFASCCCARCCLVFLLGTWRCQNYVLIRALSVALVPAANVCAATISGHEVSVCSSLLILTPGSQTLSGLPRGHRELSVAFSHSYLQSTELYNMFLCITFLGVCYSTAWCHIECGFRETVSLRDLLFSQGCVWDPQNLYERSVLFCLWEQESPHV